MRPIIFSGLWLLATTSVALAAPALNNVSVCPYSGTLPLDIPDADSSDVLDINLHNSRVQIEGVKGLTKSTGLIIVCASSLSLAKTLILETGHGLFNPHTLILRVATTNHVYVSPSDGNKPFAYVEMQLRVPDTLAVKIKSSSGSVTAANIAALRVKSDSGNITAMHISGLFRVTSNAGTIQAQDVGAVKLIKVGSGDVDLSDVAGDVKIWSLDSGALNIKNVQGNVTIDKTGTGSVQVNDVNGNFTINHKGDDAVHYADVKGTVNVPTRSQPK